MPKLRPGQQEVLKYTGGTMGVSAVPGSGKTHTLALLAARLIMDGRLADGQEVLVVTLTNSAVSNFSQRIRKFLEEQGYLGNYGYRVRTLHGLAHDLVRERPGLVGLAEDFSIVDDHAASEIFNRTAESWVAGHPEMLDAFCRDDLTEAQRRDLMKNHWLSLVTDMARSFTRKAKDLQATPATIRARLKASGADLPLVGMCQQIYHDYEQALRYRGAVDFDDLIRLAYQALILDEIFLARVQARWPFILEDEAQDSNQLQERILELLSTRSGNWVRMGDSNQAIFETFTNASPRYLRKFIRRAQYTPSLLSSGRSTQSIIQLANHLVDWTLKDHPTVDLQEETFAHTPIFPVGQDDEQSNPPDDPGLIYLGARGLQPESEISLVVASVRRWLEAHPDGTVAVLVGTNDRGSQFVQALEKANLKVIEILRSSHTTRKAAALLRDILFFLHKPAEGDRMLKMYREYCALLSDRTGAVVDPKPGERVLKGCEKVPENFLWPGVAGEWLESQTLARANPDLMQHLVKFREVLQGWQQAIVLPVDQLVLTISRDIHWKAPDLALDYKLAVVLRGLAIDHPDWELAKLGYELYRITESSLKLDNFSEDGAGFDPEAHKGEVAVATIHKAKGLEWDRVYLTSVNNYDYPSVREHDFYISERRFIQDERNLIAEALYQLEGLLDGNPEKWNADWIDIKQAARVEYARERLRLLYVGVTRAKRELTITWNTGKNGDCVAAVPFLELAGFWEKEHGHAAA